MNAALRNTLKNEADLAVLKVAQATMDQFARFRGGSGTEIAFLEQGDPKPAKGGISGDPGPCDSAT